MNAQTQIILTWVLLAITIATNTVMILRIARNARKNGLEEDIKNLEIEQLRYQNDGVNIHNEKLKAVNESVVDALIDRQEYIQVIERAVETICSLCDNAPNCEGCYWKSVQDDLILPYRNRTGIVNKEAQNKFTPPVADETDIEDCLPKLSEIELDRVQNVLVSEKTCSNCAKYAGECEGYEPDAIMECSNWKSFK